MKNSGRYKEFFIVAGCGILAVTASMSQTILYTLHVPHGMSFPYIHNFIEDYYYYLHVMRQGWEGNWLATTWFTPELFRGAFVNVWFLFLGHVARWTGIPIPLMYLIARVVGAGILLFLAFQLLRLIYPESRTKRIVSFLFVCFSTGWWGWGGNGPTPPVLVHLWTELDPLFRISFIPHHLWSKVFMIGTFLVMLSSFQKMTVAKIGLLILLTAAIGFTNPLTYATFVPTVGLWLLLEGLYKRGCSIKNHRAFGKIMPIFGSVLFIAVLVVIYHRILEQGLFPWTSYTNWEIVQQYPVTLTAYIQALGPTLLLFLLAVPALFGKNNAGRLLLAWVLSSWIMIYVVGRMVPISNSRYLGGYQFIPLGIGAAEGIWMTARFFSPYLRLSWHGVFTGMTVIILLYFCMGLLASWNEHVGYVRQNSTNRQVYIPEDVIDVFRFLETQKMADAVVLAPYWISTMTPAFTGMRVVAGHSLMTYGAETKRAAIESFFTDPSSQSSLQILDAYRVRFIIAPLSLEKIISAMSDITLIFANQTYDVYKRGAL